MAIIQIGLKNGPNFGAIMMLSVGKNRGLVIGLVVCLALAVVIPNIFLLVFGGFEAADTIIGMIIGILFISLLIGICYSLGGLVKGLTASPVSPASLMRLMYEVLGKGRAGKGEEITADDSSFQDRHPAD